MHSFWSVLYLLCPTGSPIGGWCFVVLAEWKTWYPVKGYEMGYASDK
jgi:hypothetical protein